MGIRRRCVQLCDGSIARFRGSCSEGGIVTTGGRGQGLGGRSCRGRWLAVERASGLRGEHTAAQARGALGTRWNRAGTVAGRRAAGCTGLHKNSHLAGGGVSGGRCGGSPPAQGRAEGPTVQRESGRRILPPWQRMERGTVVTPLYPWHRNLQPNIGLHSTKIGEEDPSQTFATFSRLPATRCLCRQTGVIGMERSGRSGLRFRRDANGEPATLAVAFGHCCL